MTRKIYIGDEEFIDTDDHSFFEEGRTKPTDSLNLRHQTDFDTFLSELDEWRIDERIRRMEAEERALIKQSEEK